MVTMRSFLAREKVVAHLSAHSQAHGFIARLSSVFMLGGVGRVELGLEWRLALRVRSAKAIGQLRKETTRKTTERWNQPSVVLL